MHIHSTLFPIVIWQPDLLLAKNGTGLLPGPRVCPPYNKCNILKENFRMCCYCYVT